MILIFPKIVKHIGYPPKIRTLTKLWALRPAVKRSGQNTAYSFGSIYTLHSALRLLDALLSLLPSLHPYISVIICEGVLSMRSGFIVKMKKTDYNKQATTSNMFDLPTVWSKWKGKEERGRRKMYHDNGQLLLNWAGSLISSPSWYYYYSAIVGGNMHGCTNRHTHTQLNEDTHIKYNQEHTEALDIQQLNKKECKWGRR